MTRLHHSAKSKPGILFSRFAFCVAVRSLKAPALSSLSVSIRSPNILHSIEFAQDEKKMKDTNSIFNTTYYNVFADRVSKRALILRLHVAPAAAASVVMVAAVGSLYSSHAYYIGQCAIFHSPNIPISYPVPCVECCCCCCCSLTRMWCAMVWKQQREITRVRPFANALSYECGNHVYPLWWSDTNRLALSPSLSLPHRRRRLADSAQICWRPMNEKNKR